MGTPLSIPSDNSSNRTLEIIKHATIPTLDDIHNKTSRGYILEVIETIADLESATDHLFDLNEDKLEENLDRIAKLSTLRQELINTLSIEYDIDYHCCFKHLVRSYGRLKEKIISQLRKNNYEKATMLLNVYIPIREEMYEITRLYLMKDEDFDLGCPKCQDDKDPKINNNLAQNEGEINKDLA